MQYEKYMKKAFDLALMGTGTVTPNPLVGAVIVKNNEVIAEGYHKKSGEPHAEINAIRNAKVDLKDSLLFCTLEPCCHTNKKTPPCTQEIIKHGFSKVIIANLDPNPNVSGKGVKILEEHGIEVITGVLKEYGEEVNKIFFKNMRTGLPYVHLKQAMTLDARTATSSGDSKWITSEVARDEVHEMRYAYDAVMVGGNTARLDNPTLTCRKDGKLRKVIKRIVVGKRSNLPDTLNIFSDEHKDSTIVISKSSLTETLKELSAQGVKSILLEGGETLVSGFIKENLVDEYTYYISPKLVGNGPSLFSNDQTRCINESIKLNGKWRLLPSGEVAFEGKF